MLQIRLDQRCCEVDLSGSESELMELRDALFSVSHDPNLRYLIKIEVNFDPSPYLHKLANITIYIDDGPNLIHTNKGKLFITGLLSFVKILAQNIVYFENSSGLEDGHHIHFDQVWPDSPLDKASLDRIITLE